jgi:hypothetical protein
MTPQTTSIAASFWPGDDSRAMRLQFGDIGVIRR